VYRCIQFLTEVSWQLTGLKHGFEDMQTDKLSPSFATILSGYIFGNLSPADMVLFRIWERENYILAYDRFEELLQSHATDLEGSATAARTVALNQYIEMTCHEYRSQSSYSNVERAEAAKAIVQRGSRWRSLLEGVSCVDALLLDQQAYIAHPNNIIGDVIEKGSDEEFEAMRQYLLSPDDSFKEICLRLSGIVRMIKDLADSDGNSELRNYLAKEIDYRIQEAMPPLNGTANFRVSPETRVEFTIERSHRVIYEIFGISSTGFPDDMRAVRPGSQVAGNNDFGSARQFSQPSSPSTSGISCHSDDPLGLRGEQKWQSY
jgi:hypothetical protein